MIETHVRFHSAGRTLALALVMALAITIFGMISASDAASAAVTGTVTTADSGPIPGLTVNLQQWTWNGVFWSYTTVASTTTNVSGYFSFGGAYAAGDYRLRVSTPGYYIGYAYLDAWDGVSSVSRTITLIPIVAADEYEDDDFRVQATPTAPGASQLHSIYDVDDEDWIRIDVEAGHTYVIQTNYPWGIVTGHEADTVLTLLGADGWEILAQNDDIWDPPFSQITYVAEETGTRYVRVIDAAGSTGWYDFSFRDVTPEIAGKVTSSANGLPIKGVEVRAWDWDPDDVTWYFAGGTVTDANGRYAFADMGSSEYFLEFLDEEVGDGYYLSEYYHDQADLAGADPVVTAMGSTTTVNESLDPSPPSISGTVTEEGSDGDPVPWAAITAWEWDGDWYEAGWATTQEDGTYAIYGLGAGAYTVEFNDQWDSDGLHEVEYWDDAGSLGSADQITTAVGVEVSGIDAELAPSALCITGTVTDEVTAEPLNGIEVAPYVWNGASWDAGTYAYTGEDGVYRFYDFMPGTYRLEFRDPSSYWGYYVAEYWNDEALWDNADPVDFTGATFTADAQLTPGAPDITGRVTDEVSGDPLENIAVTWYWPDAGSWSPGEQVSTDENGEYAIYGLAQGMQTRIGFEDGRAQDGSYRAEFWNDKATIDLADGIFIEATFGWPYSNIDAELTPGDPSIAGTVSDADTTDPLPGATVYLWEFTGTDEWVVDAMSTYADGTYEFCDLGASTYWVQFEKPGYLGYSCDEIAYPGTGLVTVDGPMVPIEGDIGGTVRDAVTGYTIPDANVDLYWFSGSEFYLEDVVTSNASGRYRFDDVSHGGYKLVSWAFGFEDGEMLVEFDGIPVTRDLLLTPLPTDAAVRVADRTRFSTAVDIARMAFDEDGDPSNGTQWTGVEHVILASGDDRAAADPLAASGLCGLYDAPLFLISQTTVPAEAKVAVKEIADQSGDAITVHIVGGTTSVPDARYNELAAYVGAGMMKDRIQATGGRYDLAAAIARRIADESWTPEVVLVANGADPNKFFDALALSPISARQLFPIVLVSADTIPAATQNVIDEIDPTTVVVGGGPNTVSNSVVTSLGALRWYGGSRYTTAIRIADEAIDRSWLDDHAVGIAAKLPDALTGGGVIGRMGGPLLLTKSDVLTPETGAWLTTHAGSITNCYVFGGPNSVSSTVVASITAILD